MQINNLEMRRRAGFLTISDVARILGVSHWSLRYLLRHGYIPGPAVTINDKPRAYYTPEDVEKIREAIALTEGESK